MHKRRFLSACTNVKVYINEQLTATAVSTAVEYEKEINVKNVWVGLSFTKTVILTLISVFERL